MGITACHSFELARVQNWKSLAPTPRRRTLSHSILIQKFDQLPNSAVGKARTGSTSSLGALC